jgi:hypothetical protein
MSEPITESKAVLAVVDVFVVAVKGLFLEFFVPLALVEDQSAYWAFFAKVRPHLCPDFHSL